MKLIVIAIDGPSGGRQGHGPRTVSHVLGFRHIDTGAMYRAVGWKALHDCLALDDGPAVAALAERADLTSKRAWCS
jgi:CMP/dCMP kinase